MDKLIAKVKSLKVQVKKNKIATNLLEFKGEILYKMK